jgi:hypothetical protein
MTAFFPIGMESYNNTTTAPFTQQFAPNKGIGIDSYPVGITSGNQRPLTNRDYNNTAVYKIGASRPLKWAYRKGYNQRIPTTQSSSTLIGQLMDRPGQYITKQNNIGEINNVSKLNKDCESCKGVGLVVDFAPETPYLTNNPQPVCTSRGFCCNEEKKALRLVRPAPTLLKKNYYTTTKQYLQNRCQTYEQRAFNFTPISDIYTNVIAKPGSPKSLENTYIGQCYSNSTTEYNQRALVENAYSLIYNNGLFSAIDVINYDSKHIYTLSEFYTFLLELSSIQNSIAAIQIYNNFITNPYIGLQSSSLSNQGNCKLVVYKPSNYQFAVEGGVDSSTRTYKLALNTIKDHVCEEPGVPYVYKQKSQPCSRALPIIFRQVSYNPKSCYMKTTNSVNGNIGSTVM